MSLLDDLKSAYQKARNNHTAGLSAEADRITAALINLITDAVADGRTCVAVIVECPTAVPGMVRAALRQHGLVVADRFCYGINPGSGMPYRHVFCIYGWSDDPVSPEAMMDKIDPLGSQVAYRGVSRMLRPGNPNAPVQTGHGEPE